MTAGNQGGQCVALVGGGSRGFCTYDFSFVVWDCGNVTPTPVSAGGALGGGFNGCAFGFAGGGTRVFFGGGPWCPTYSPSRLADAPAPVGAGACIAKGPALAGAPVDSVFALRGGNTTDFWLYDVTTHAWHSLPAAPASVDDGGCITGVDEFHGELPPLPVSSRTWGSIKQAYR